MTCEKFETFLPDMVLDSAQVPADVRRHVLECSVCRAELDEFVATMRLLNTWEAPAPTPYFDTRMMARLRQEKNSPAPGWLERMRTRLMFGSGLQLRPAMAAAFALLLIAGGGSYEGFVSLNRTPHPQQTVSATVADLELFDSNAQTLQQMAAFDDADGVPAQASNANGSN